jgi:DNA-binding IclR family transcriptional regulator
VESKAKTARIREVPAVTRAVSILRELGRTDQPLGVNHLARKLNIVPSTCLHILRALHEEGLVELDPMTKRYKMGLGILTLARAAIQRNDFTARVQPELNELTAKFEIAATATQLTDPWNMMIVAASQSKLPFTLRVDLGSRFPALISATGRCLAAFNNINPDEIQTRFRQLIWSRAPEFEDWKEEVTVTRETGYGVDPGNYISGVTVVAVPIFDAENRMRRSLITIGITEQVREIGVPVLADALMAIRERISAYDVGGKF